MEISSGSLPAVAGSTLRTWLGNADAVIVHDGEDPLVIMRWGPWA
jgi:hypothetical protein